jgi:hypothetical protein
MQKGFNSDITVKGTSFHIQTEDWGTKNPFIVTRVFAGGAVKATIKTAYSDLLNEFSARSELAIKNALRRQHADTIDNLVSGKIQI